MQSVDMACTIPTDRRTAAMAAAPLNYNMVRTRLEATQGILDAWNVKYEQLYDRWLTSHAARSGSSNLSPQAGDTVQQNVAEIKQEMRLYAKAREAY